jgi:tRNA dimethylallyltransferase
LIDVVEPDCNFTAGDFCRNAADACRSIFSNGRYPLFIGGTAFYIDSFFIGLSEIPGIDEGIREELKILLKEKGLPLLYEELQRCDYVFSQKIHENDKQRILRGLEVFKSTGHPLTYYYTSRTGHGTDETRYLGLYPDRNELHKRIDRRVDLMINSGFIDEVVNIRKMGYGPELKSMKSIGYLELNQYLDGFLTLNEAVDRIKIETRKYAKRQMTWFNRNKKIQWFDISNLEDIKTEVKKFVNQ